MSQKLEPLKQLEKKVQEQLLQCSLIEMLIMQSVLFCDPDRQSWGLLDVRDVKYPKARLKLTFFS